jgi:gamma-glutamyltranspeptidase/glutathione hydrolase
MMAPTVVLADGRPQLVLGSGGSNRIRSAILQTVINIVDHQMSARAAVNAPRLHYENNIVYAEPGVDTEGLERLDLAVARFSSLNLFFGGVHAAFCDSEGNLQGVGDPRRGGESIIV